MMKFMTFFKTQFTICALIAAFALTGCNNNTSEPNPEPSPEPGSTNAVSSAQTNSVSQNVDKVPMPPMPNSISSSNKVNQVVEEIVANTFKVHNVNAEQAAQLIKDNKELVILDIRTAQEIAEGMIPAAVNIDFNDAQFANKLKELDPAKDYLIHCRSGGRSNRSLNTFKSLGFGNIYHLDGGFLGWEKAGLETNKPE